MFSGEFRFVAGVKRKEITVCGLAAVKAQFDSDPKAIVRRMLGERGMVVISPEGVVERIPTTAREVYDVVGAGDPDVSEVAGCALRASLQLAAGDQSRPDARGDLDEDERKHVAVITAALTAQLGADRVYEYGEVPGESGITGTLPPIFVLPSIERRYAAPDRNGRSGRSGWRLSVATRFITMALSEARASSSRWPASWIGS